MRTRLVIGEGGPSKPAVPNLYVYGPTVTNGKGSSQYFLIPINFLGHYITLAFIKKNTLKF